MLGTLTSVERDVLHRGASTNRACPSFEKTNPPCTILARRDRDAANVTSLFVLRAGGDGYACSAMDS